MSYRNLQARSIDDYEIINQCGSGTYGYVFKAVHRQTRTIVALKKVSQYPVEEGAPVEIKYLSQLYNSRNIIKLKDSFMTREGELALVFEYMETDLWRLISGPSACLPLYQIKCIMKQLFEGLHQCHSAGIMHRDIKPSNLLISSSGVLKLADFGLTTSYISPPYLSNNVVSLYYRSPELLMGSRAYGPEIDVWSAGCILVELLTNNYLFAGANEGEQLDMIFKVFGTPSEDVWPGVSQLPGWGLVESASILHPLRCLRDNYQYLDPNVLDLASKLLTLDPRTRISCHDALQHPWFWTTPLPCHPNRLPSLWKSRADPVRREWRKAASSSSSSSSGTSERRDRESAGSSSSTSSIGSSNISGSVSSIKSGVRTTSLRSVSDQGKGANAPSISGNSSASGSNTSTSASASASLSSTSNSTIELRSSGSSTNELRTSGNLTITPSNPTQQPEKGLRVWRNSRGNIAARDEPRERPAPYRPHGQV